LKNFVQYMPGHKLLTDNLPTMSAAEATPETSPPVRRAFHGSCHCGHVKYIAYITLPTDYINPSQPPADRSRIYKCNCTTCKKMGIFHLRPIDPPKDFQILSPLNPTTGGLSEYKCFDKNTSWYFCGTCGVRCFGFKGEGEVRTEDVGGEKKEVWGFIADKWDKSKKCYLSVNAVTLEPGQEGLDLREWTEKGWVAYFDFSEKHEDQMGKPHPGDPY
jgi:hypothetical protein